MNNRINRDAGYVLVQDKKQSKGTQYYYDSDDDDDNDSQMATVTRRVIRTKPTKEQRIKYISTDDLQYDHRRQSIVEPNSRKLKMRRTSNGDPVVLDEDDNVIKIIRNARSPTPPPVIKNRSVKIRPRQPQTLYYETSDGQFVTQPPKNHTIIKPRTELTYRDDEPTKLLRKLIIDPRTGDQETIYENKPQKQHRKKYIVRKQINESPLDSDDEDGQQIQPQYVQVVQRQPLPIQTIIKQEKPTSKYVMIRKKVDSEPDYGLSSSSIPTLKNNQRIVYETPTKKPSATYVYSTSGKYYK
ncbi:unnamed protein product [Adineta steineri]|uniref:Uncharacterized protein n=1 Tax=Adineta steineri TaxID=433720 RepID=A0A813PRI3_9BILA|nr:unnamed protein product [Adineta steineri]CAF0866484.1 unnamed protein product [Adineta steineri]